jgi:hypothetical protein
LIRVNERGEGRGIRRMAEQDAKRMAEKDAKRMAMNKMKKCNKLRRQLSEKT